MDIENIERVNVLSKKVMNSEATIQELSEYKSLLQRWADTIDSNTSLRDGLSESVDT